MQNFEELIRKDFCFLFDHYNFKFIKDVSINEMSPFSAVAIIEEGDIRLRFIKDRADFFLDIGGSRNPQEWLSIYKFLSELRSKGHINEYIKPLNNPKAISKILKKYFDLIKLNMNLIIDLNA